jgi:hypothetical protein
MRAVTHVCVSFRTVTELGLMAHACNLSTWEAEAGESRVPGKPGLPSETLSQKAKSWGCSSVVESGLHLWHR